MNLEKTMSRLSDLGTEQNRTVYRRHGKVDPLFGVSYANLKKLAKEIKKDQSLAGSLWETGNHDARILAAMIADPDAITVEAVMEWTNDLKNYMQSDALSGLVARTPFWKDVMYGSIASEREFVKACGYSILSSALKDERVISKEELTVILSRIGSEILSSANRARYSMNGAVIAIGIFRPELFDAAIDTGRSIGKVEVDHGETSCATPDIVEYLTKVNQRKKQRGYIQ